MHLENKYYDFMKWLVMLVLPAVAVLVQGLGELYGLIHLDTYISTLNLFTAFLGTILQISSLHYHDGGGSGNGPGQFAY